MKLAIFGATGRAGQVLVEQALEAGHSLSLLVRDPSKLTDPQRFHIVEGTVQDPDAVAKTIAGADAVVSVLGGGRKGTGVCTEGMQTILPAMSAAGIRRLLVLSNYGVAETRRGGLYVWVSWKLEPGVLQDKEGMEELIRASDTEWTVVRAPVLTNGARKGKYRTGTDLRLGFTSKVSRADIVAFMLAELAENNYVRQPVGVTD